MAEDLHRNTEGLCAASSGSVRSMSEGLKRCPAGNSQRFFSTLTSAIAEGGQTELQAQSN
jgi:hypothetical protein